MSAEENKAVVRRFWEELWNQRNQDVVGELVAPKEIPHVKIFYNVFLGACPDLTVTIDDILAEGELVAERITFRGTQTGPLNMPGVSIPPTGKTLSTRMVEIWRVHDGKMTDHWGEWDRAGLMQQLGLEGSRPAPVSEVR
jgi:predicted ester cyclase